jgi:hypothetical protein
MDVQFKMQYVYRLMGAFTASKRSKCHVVVLRDCEWAEANIKAVWVLERTSRNASQTLFQLVEKFSKAVMGLHACEGDEVKQADPNKGLRLAHDSAMELWGKPCIRKHWILLGRIMELWRIAF